MILTLISLLNGLCMGIIGPVLPLYLRSFGVSMATVGVVFTVRMFGFMIFEPIFGGVSDRFGHKKIIFFTSIG